MATFDLIAETGHDQSAGFHFTASTQEEAGAPGTIELAASPCRVGPAGGILRAPIDMDKRKPKERGPTSSVAFLSSALPIGPFTGCHRARENTS